MSEQAFVHQGRPASTFEPSLPTSALLVSLNAVVSHVFQAGLALDALQRSAETDYGKARAAAAVAALDEALCELRNLATALVSANQSGR